MSLIVSHDAFQLLVRTLSEIPEPDTVDRWPVAQFELLTEAGGNRWNIPREFGGDGADDAEMLEVYRELASGSLLTAFILTQRNAACQRIATSTNEVIKERLLPALCEGRSFATVGISHLTTSRQHLNAPAVVASADRSSDDFSKKSIPLMKTFMVIWMSSAKRSPSSFIPAFRPLKHELVQLMR